MRAILTYHSIDDSGSPISVSPAQFRAHCEFLGSGRVRVLPVPALLALPSDQDAVAITFDDGFANFHHEALPALEEHGLRATVFVVTDHVGAHNDWGRAPAPGIPHLPLMDWDQLGTVRERGHEIGAHTRTHPHLTTLSDGRLASEVGGCAARIRERLGVDPTIFAYPYGSVDARSAELVRERYAAACTTELRPLRRHDDHVLLPRLDMFYLRSAGLLGRWGSATFRSLLWVRSRGRQVKALFAGPREHLGHVA